MFGLNRFSIPPNEVLDCLYRARGVYESDETGALLRTFNPLWWMKKVFVSFIQIPFSLFRVAGFDTTGIEASIFGKLVELIVGFITLAAAVLAIVNLLGGIDWLKAALGIDASFWRNL